MAQKAIIIGAGPAGLTAAYQFLKETDIQPIILEESDSVGGLSRTVAYQGNRMDLGGHRFFSKNEEVTALWRELMPLQGAPAKDDLLLGREKPLVPGGPDPERQERVSLIRDRVSRIFYLRKFFDYPISFKWETFAQMGLTRTLQGGLGYLGSCLHKRPEHSLEDFMINRFGKPLYHMFFEDYTQKLWGRHPSQIAADWGAQRIKGLSLSKALGAMVNKALGRQPKQVETSLIEQFMYPKRGPGQLWETMAQEITRREGVIQFNTPVTGLALENGRAVAARVSQGGEETLVYGDYFLSTMPLKDLVSGLQPQPPQAIRRIADGLPYRDFITVGLLVSRLALTNQTNRPTVGHIVPDCWIYIQEREVKLGRLQIFNNWSPYMVKDLAHTVWLGLEYFCDEGDSLWRMTDEDFIAFAAGELAQIGVIRREDVLDGVRLRVKKAYPAYFDTYGEFDTLRAWLDTVSNLYCIGRNGQHRYNNMDHSMLCAMEAVKAIRTGSADKTPIWQVNTEEAYHEEKE